MKTMSLLLMAIAITACSEAAKPPRDVAIGSATARMFIASGDNVPGDLQYVTLGKVRAHCMENPQASYITAIDIIADGDDIQLAAYREYGSEVERLLMSTYFMSVITRSTIHCPTMRATSNVRAPQSISTESKHNE